MHPLPFYYDTSIRLKNKTLRVFKTLRECLKTLFHVILNDRRE